MILNIVNHSIIIHAAAPTALPLSQLIFKQHFLLHFPVFFLLSDLSCAVKYLLVCSVV